MLAEINPQKNNSGINQPEFLKENNLYLEESQLAGKGVFSSTGFNKGDTIERCPLILFTDKDLEYLPHTNLYQYCCIPGHKNSTRFLALGYGAFYNHDAPSNAECTINENEKICTIKAVRSITANEEITINYNGAYNDNTEVVFATKNEVYDFSVNLF